MNEHNRRPARPVHTHTLARLVFGNRRNPA